MPAGPNCATSVQFVHDFSGQLEKQRLLSGCLPKPPLPPPDRLSDGGLACPHKAVLLWEPVIADPDPCAFSLTLEFDQINNIPIRHACAPGIRQHNGPVFEDASLFAFLSRVLERNWITNAFSILRIIASMSAL